VHRSLLSQKSDHLPFFIFERRCDVSVSRSDRCREERLRLLPFSVRLLHGINHLGVVVDLDLCS
jgi:hypothetical protein